MRQIHNNENRNILRRTLENLARTKLYLTSSARRDISPIEMSKSRNIYEAIARNRKDDMPLAKHETQPMNPHFAGLIEQELQMTSQKKSSALLEKATVQKRGRNDFLVFESSDDDPFVTVIPNNIYYSIEKSCVNWLDDCSLKGIRERLLQKEYSPFK